MQRGLPLALARGVLASNVAALRTFSTKTAKSLVIDEFGKPEEVLRLEHHPIREPGEGEVSPNKAAHLENARFARPSLWDLCTFARCSRPSC